MKILTEGDSLLLDKNGVQIGHCRAKALADGTLALLEFFIAPEWRRKGYGSYLCKEWLKRTGGYDAKRESRYCIALHVADQSEDGQLPAKYKATTAQGIADQGGTADCNAATAEAFPFAFFEKFGFVREGAAFLTRHHKPDLTAITFAHTFLTQHLRAPQLCIDATCGNGHDTLFLAQLMPENGRLIALDIQPEAIAQTEACLSRAGILPTQYQLHCADHANLAQYAAQGTADAILFNFGWLPGADHAVFSGEDSSLPALDAALRTLKKGGILSAILYSGEGIGHAEKEAILHWMRALPLTEYTVLTCQFANWADTAPLPCFVLKK